MCVLTAHTECSGVAPIANFISNVKSSPAMLDREQTLKELGSFDKIVTEDKEENIQEIITRKKEICEEIMTTSISYKSMRLIYKLL
jgi:Zn-dependent oligopeptidase